MLRKLALSLAVSAALGASQVNALGLGEIQVNSALNEPLDAEIKLTQVRDLSPLQIQPRMASLDEYATSGDGRQSRYLRDIQFQVLVSPEGTGRIRLKSSEPVQEPFLNFMVEVNWPSGRLVREYTLLLDPPLFDASPVSRSVTPTTVQASTPAAQSLPGSTPVTPVKSTRTLSHGSSQVAVGMNDTLWDIAKKTKPEGVTEHQMMLALLRKNPQAFLSGNINNLKAGTVMDLPSAAEANQLSHRESVAEVARQMQLWRDGRATAKTPTKAPLDVSKAENTTSTDTGLEESGVAEGKPDAADAPEEGKLTVLAPPKDAEEAQKVTSATSSVDQGVEEDAAAEQSEEQVISPAAERLENEVLMAQEKIDRLERDNEDLNSKLNSMLEQLESQSRLLELQSQQMSTLQSEMSRPQPVPVQQPAPASKGMTSLLDNPTVVGGVGAGVIALLGGLWLIMRRKKSADNGKRDLVSVPDNLRSEDRDTMPDVAAAAAGGAAAVVASEALSAEQDENVSADTEFVRPPMEALAPAEDDVSDASVADLEQDLQELDLDMDLDLDDLSQEEQKSDEIVAPEFDLGLDEEPVATLADDVVAEAAEQVEEQAAEVDELDFALSAREDDEELSELDSMLADQDAEEDDLDFLLNESGVSAEAELDFDLDDEAVDDALDFGAGAVQLDDDAESSAEEVVSADSELDNSLHETVEAASEVEFEIDPALEAMLQGGNATESEADVDDGLEFDLDFADDEPAVEVTDTAEDDLESLLTSFVTEEDGDRGDQNMSLSGEAVEEELTANISHDLEMDLDSEVEELLGSTDDDIELEEQLNDESDEEILDKMNLLSDADEIETKLDLARAYIEMEDGDGARDILNEIASEGSTTQRDEAQKLLESLA